MNQSGSPGASRAGLSVSSQGFVFIAEEQRSERGCSWKSLRVTMALPAAVSSLGKQGDQESRDIRKAGTSLGVFPFPGLSVCLFSLCRECVCLCRAIGVFVSLSRTIAVFVSLSRAIGMFIFFSRAIGVFISLSRAIAVFVFLFQGYWCVCFPL